MDAPRDPDDPKGQVWILCPCAIKITIDFLSRDAGSEAKVRIEGSNEGRAESGSVVGCELLVGNGFESVYHGIGVHLWSLSLEHWDILSSWDEKIEEVGVEKLRNRGKRHDLGGFSGMQGLGGRRHGSCGSERRLTMPSYHHLHRGCGVQVIIFDSWTVDYKTVLTSPIR